MHIEKFQQINVLYLSLLMGQLMALAAIYFAFQPENRGDTFALVIPLAIVGGLVGAYLLYQKRKEEGRAIEGEEKKIEHYRISIILRSFLLEAPNLLAIIAYFLDGNSMYLVYFAVGIAAFLYFRPSETEFERDYKGV